MALRTISGVIVVKAGNRSSGTAIIFLRTGELSGGAAQCDLIQLTTVGNTTPSSPRSWKSKPAAVVSLRRIEVLPGDLRNATENDYNLDTKISSTTGHRHEFLEIKWKVSSDNEALGSGRGIREIGFLVVGESKDE